MAGSTDYYCRECDKRVNLSTAERRARHRETATHKANVARINRGPKPYKSKYGFPRPSHGGFTR